jgi:hypothetical protein
MEILLLPRMFQRLTEFRNEKAATGWRVALETWQQLAVLAHKYSESVHTPDTSARAHLQSRLVPALLLP